MAFVTFGNEQSKKKAMKLNNTTVKNLHLIIEPYKKLPKSRNIVCVRNIARSVTKEDLRKLFEQAGPIAEIYFTDGSYAAKVGFKESDGFCKAFLLNEEMLGGQAIYLQPFSEMVMKKGIKAVPAFKTGVKRQMGPPGPNRKEGDDNPKRFKKMNE